MDLEIEITRNDTGRILDALKARFTTGQLNEIAAVSAASLVREHLYEFGRSHPNKIGGKRTDFYGSAGDATRANFDDQSASVSIHRRGVAQRRFGGPIDPVRRQFLTFATHPDSYGKSPFEFDDLRPLFNRAGTGGIMYRGPRPKKGELVGDENILFVMTKHVEQDPDPAVLPTNDEIRGNVRGAFRSYYESWNLRA